MGDAPRARASRRWWLALAVCLRLALAATPGYAFDVRLFRSWARTLLGPWAGFYAHADGADHLPGDIVLHGLLARACAAVGVAPDTGGYAYALKLVPAAGDLALAGACWWLLRRCGRDGWPAALLVLLSPAVLYVSGVWGQWDSVSLAMATWALALVWTRSQWLWTAGPLAAWSVLVKPPLALPLLVGAGAYLALAGARGLWPRVASALVTGLATAAALCAPFGLGPAGLLGRVRYAADLWPVTTMGAPNLWMALHGSPWQPPRDDGVRWVGTLLLAAALGTVALRVGRVAGRRRLAGVAPSGVPADAVALACWAAAASTYASFALLTRAHERYALPGVVLLGVLACLTGERRHRWLWAASSVLLLASALAANLLPAHPPASWWLRVAPFEAMSLGTLAVLAGVLATPPHRPGRAGTPHRAG